MSKWRPHHSGCIYVIPDIHGRFDELKLICNRILPLRNNKTSKDILIFLGDYIDRGENSAGVINFLIEIKEKYKDQVIFLRGNHEQLLMDSLFNNTMSGYDARSIWLNNGGVETVKSYFNILNRTDFNFKKESIFEVIPKTHLDFFLDTKLYYETDDYIFVHAGCNLNKPMHEQTEMDLLWDRNLYNTKAIMQRAVFRRRTDIPDPVVIKKTIVTGHNYKGPFISDDFLMLDASAFEKLFIVDLQSMKAFFAENGKSRLVKYDLFK